MSNAAFTVHPSMQRYLPGHLPKRDRRLYTGETNRKAYENFHKDLVQNEVAHHLTLPSRIAQCMVPSVTVIRASKNNLGENIVNGKDSQMPLTSSIGNNLPNIDTISIEQVLNRTNDNGTTLYQDILTSKSLINSSTDGKEHGFSEETFYFGSRNIGGAGQMEYNEPNKPYGRNHPISAWKTRYHFSPKLWFSIAEKNLYSTPQRLQTKNNTREPATSPISKIIESRELDHKNSNNEKNKSTTSSKKQNLKSKPKDNWIPQYNPPNYYDVPPPKLRFELTDYHPTFHHTQATKESALYTSESTRFRTIKKIPLNTPDNIIVHKTARRMYPDIKQ